MCNPTQYEMWFNKRFKDDDEEAATSTAHEPLLSRALLLNSVVTNYWFHYKIVDNNEYSIHISGFARSFICYNLYL